jgi:peroxiredoxin
MRITTKAAPALLILALCAAGYAEEKAAEGAKSAPAAASETKSEDSKAGEAKSDKAKDFTLPDAEGKNHSLADYKGKIVVLEWTNPECPFVQRHYKSGSMKKLAAKYADKGVVWLAINSTKHNTPADSKAWTEKQGITYPTLQDPDGTVGHLYNAKTTPHMFVIDRSGNIAYQGAIDDDPKGELGDGAKNYVEGALTKLLAGEKPEITETKPYGCSVKYKN